MLRIGIALALMTAGSLPAHSADAVKGKQLFRAQCALCHSAAPGDNGGALGPNLADVVGRKAAGVPGFGYTQALSASKLTLESATLSRFLAAPTTVVPGTAMVVAVPGKSDRDDLVAYFSALKAGTYKDPIKAPPPPRTAQAPAGNAKSGADWKLDLPGRVHHLSADKLPPPYDTPGASNSPKFVPKPEGARLKLPPGFDVTEFASGNGLQNPRNMRLAPNGDIILVESSPGRIKILRPGADGKTAASIFTFAQGLDRPFGLALYPLGNEPRWLYVGEINRVVRYAYEPGQTEALGVPEIVIPALAPDMSGGHVTRDLAFSLDGKKLYVSVGSQSNVPEDLPVKTPEQIVAWEKKSMVGAAWGREEQRAVVLEFDAEKPGPAKYFATGLRNCVGLTMHPSGDLWCTVNERDMLGDDLVPDYSTRVKPGAFYGWPWFYLGAHEDPRLPKRPDLAGKITVPDVLFQAHSAAITLTFYPMASASDKGTAAFPKEYQGDGFVAMHGSWNRAFRTGHKIVRVKMKDGVPTGEYEDFMVGFITDDGDSWGRPAGTVVAADGALLVSEDAGNIIYRISYRPGVDIAGVDIEPESITSLADGTVIAGTARRSIYRTPPGGNQAQPWIELPADSPPMVFGVLADEKTSTLWACVAAYGEAAKTAPPSALYAFDLASGKHKAHYPLPAKEALCNDIAVGNDGSVYATDTVNNEISRLAPRAKKLELWAGNGAFGPKEVALDGIAILGNRVMVNTINGNKLFGVPIGRNGKAGKAVEIQLDHPLQTPDGMRTAGENSMLVVENLPNGRLSRIDVLGDMGTVTAIETHLPRGANAVTISGKSIWVLETATAFDDGTLKRVRAVQVQ